MVARLGKLIPCAVLAGIVIAAGAVAVGVGNGGQADATSYTVTPVYFYPNDVQPNEQYLAQIASAVASVQEWYRVQVGKTFVVDPVVTVRGDHDAAWYGCSPYYCGSWEAPWYNVLGDLGPKGYGACGSRGLIVFLGGGINFQGGGSCGAPYTAQSGGVAMFTETLLNPMAGFGGDRDDSLGVLAHEVGHSFTLLHPPDCGVTDPAYCQQTVMWAWWNFPNEGLLDLAAAPERSTLFNSPFFTSTGGNPTATPTPPPALTPTPTPTPADTTAPTVTLSSPLDGSRFSGRVLTVSARGSDDRGVTRMEVYVDSKLVRRVDGSSLTYDFNVKRSKQTTMTVVVKAFDTAGNGGEAQARVYR